MRTKLIAFAAIATMQAAMAAAASNAAEVASARAFLRALYAHYERNDSFAILGDKEEPEYFAADTLKLLRENTRLLQGEVGDIEVDPVCVCQDSAGLKATIGDVVMTGPASARATVLLKDTGSPKFSSEIRFDLVFERGKWRIQDLGWKDKQYRPLASYRAALIKENRTLSASARH